VPQAVIQLVHDFREDDAIDIRNTVGKVDVRRVEKGKEHPRDIDKSNPPSRHSSSDEETPYLHPGIHQHDSLEGYSNQSLLTVRGLLSAHRRPSHEFAAQLGSMQLSPNISDGSTPREEASPLRCPGPTAAARSTDPFAESFAQVMSDDPSLSRYNVSYSISSP